MCIQDAQYVTHVTFWDRGVMGFFSQDLTEESDDLFCLLMQVEPSVHAGY